VQLGADFAPKKNGNWEPSYHGLLYNLTDDAVQGEGGGCGALGHALCSAWPAAHSLAAAR
jgi:hypothetical protein